MRRRLTWAVGAAEIVALVFSIELRTWHGRGTWTGDPKGKVLIASWLASELWLNPWLFGASLAALTTTVAVLVRARRARAVAHRSARPMTRSARSPG
jgi:hypothetical protein